MNISLVVPVKNEENSLEALYASICNQTFLPNEMILVDGGSTDKTLAIAERLANGKVNLKIIKTAQASPGKGRNIGVENSENDWIAFTDAGITLEKNWLENLVKVHTDSPEADIIYGNYAPVTDSFFEKCAAITYVPFLRKDRIRGKSIVSCLLRKKVWETVGGFPDLRAAEDLIFMEEAEKKGFTFAFAPQARLYWTLAPDTASTFRKFVLYSKYNVWAGRQYDWHYGIRKQYLVIFLFILLSAVHNPLWSIGVFLWLIARTAKRILPHRSEFGWQPLINPVYFLSIMFLIVVIDIATFAGWIQALLNKEGLKAQITQH